MPMNELLEVYEVLETAHKYLCHVYLFILLTECPWFHQILKEMYETKNVENGRQSH